MLAIHYIDTIVDVADGEPTNVEWYGANTDRTSGAPGAFIDGDVAARRVHPLYGVLGSFAPAVSSLVRFRQRYRSTR